jgi:hypothetical protein
MRILLLIDIHFCQFANRANAIKANKLPLLSNLKRVVLWTVIPINAQIDLLILFFFLILPLQVILGHHTKVYNIISNIWIRIFSSNISLIKSVF